MGKPLLKPVVLCHTRNELCGLRNGVHGWLEDPLPFCSQLASSAHFSQLSGESPFGWIWGTVCRVLAFGWTQSLSILFLWC